MDFQDVQTPVLEASNRSHDGSFVLVHRKKEHNAVDSDSLDATEADIPAPPIQVSQGMQSK